MKAVDVKISIKGQAPIRHRLVVESMSEAWKKVWEEMISITGSDGIPAGFTIHFRTVAHG